jgi:outer membrane lipoprotein-sorting protein
MWRGVRVLGLIAAISSVFVSSAHAVDASSTDPKAIMQAVEGREAPGSSKFKLTITITDASGRNRTRVLQAETMAFAEGSKQIVLFEEPADLRNAGLLSIDYEDGSKADDQWLYLPSLGKTTRIASADKSGSFMGTDLTYADMTSKDPNAYTYTMVQQSVAVDGEDCWLIEATPATDKELKETGYTKSQVWVSKAKMVPMQVKAWVADGRFKYTKMSNFQMVDGNWVANQVVVRTIRNDKVESTSTLVTSGLVVDPGGITDADFTEQRLQQGL